MHSPLKGPLRIIILSLSFGDNTNLVWFEHGLNCTIKYTMRIKVLDKIRKEIPGVSTIFNPFLDYRSLTCPIVLMNITHRRKFTVVNMSCWSRKINLARQETVLTPLFAGGLKTSRSGGIELMERRKIRERLVNFLSKIMEDIIEGRIREN
jgi:hypothetical protein